MLGTRLGGRRPSQSRRLQRSSRANVRMLLGQHKTMASRSLSRHCGTDEQRIVRALAVGNDSTPARSPLRPAAAAAAPAGPAPSAPPPPRQTRRPPQVSAHAAAAPAATAPSLPQHPPAFSLPPANVILLPNGQRTHSLHEEGFRVIESMGSWAQQNIMHHLKPVERCWQPADFLPEPESPDFLDEVQALRSSGRHLPAEYLVVLVGDMLTEEALPSYMSMINRMDGAKDETGAQDHPWAQWTRMWTAEEHRHGALLNKALYLRGRVNMKSLETTVQRLISSGLDPRLENNPYLCFVYTSFQERATKISHVNTAKLASQYGDQALAKVCGVIAADEGRHELAYQAIVQEFINRDPDGAVLAFADMMRKGILMPAHWLDDGVHSARNHGSSLFDDYATLADSIGVYTTGDYANVVEHLVKKWRIADVTGLSGNGAAAQEYLCGHAARIRRLANIQRERRERDRRRGKTRTATFDWLWGQQVALQ